jgi:hypothetical protein
MQLLILDNVQSLLSFDMKDEMPWQQTLPWVRDLTRRNIGQIWAHHTGHDESHGYGPKTREWQLGTVVRMETIEQPGADIAFSLKFSKARECSPENRSDFDPAVITPANDAWTSEQSSHVRTKHNAKDRALEFLKDAIAREDTIPSASISRLTHCALPKTCGDDTASSATSPGDPTMPPEWPSSAPPASSFSEMSFMAERGSNMFKVFVRTCSG